MKRRMIAGWRFWAVVLAVGVSAAALTAWGDGARFLAGGWDGYAASVYVQTSPDMYPRKFKGGDKDGWGIGMATGLMATGLNVVKPKGTVFIMR